jgi:hypothetical protein
MRMRKELKCASCGCFVAYADIAGGVIGRTLITSESLRADDALQTLCDNCKNPDGCEDSDCPVAK